MGKVTTEDSSWQSEQGGMPRPGSDCRGQVPEPPLLRGGGPARAGQHAYPAGPGPPRRRRGPPGPRGTGRRAACQGAQAQARARALKAACFLGMIGALVLMLPESRQVVSLHVRRGDNVPSQVTLAVKLLAAESRVVAYSQYPLNPTWTPHM
jgi:hypothetical protein